MESSDVSSDVLGMINAVIEISVLLVLSVESGQYMMYRVFDAVRLGFTLKKWQFELYREVDL